MKREMEESRLDVSMELQELQEEMEDHRLGGRELQALI